MEDIPKIEGYTYLSLLGQGAMGQVYKVFKDGQYYAMKYLINNRYRYRTIDKEIYILQHLPISPFFPIYYSYIEIENYVVILMEYIEGQTLGQIWRDFFDNKSYFSQSSVKNIMNQLLIAITLLQKNKIVHQDIKPDNIIIDNDQLKLIDFGLSCMFPTVDCKSQFRCDIPVGSKRYMAPEAIDFSIREHPELFSNLDVYAFGKIAVQIATMVEPPLGSNEEFLDAIKNSYPENVYTVMKLALTQDPYQRPDAETLLKLL